MRFALIQHTHETTAGNVLPWLKDLEQKKRVQLTHINFANGDQVPQSKDFDAFIFCGGEMHPDQDEKYPHLKGERELIKEALSQNKKVLGICLGAQICAQVLGAKTLPHPKGWEIGWQQVRLHDQEPQNIRVFQFHRYVFDLPMGAKLEASSDWWGCQGFSWKDQLLAYQFHPEAEVSWVLEAAEEPELSQSGNVQKKESLIAETLESQKKAEAWYLNKISQFFKIGNRV